MVIPLPPFPLLLFQTRLLNLVKQRFVTDLKCLCRSLAVPMCALKGFRYEIALYPPRSRPGRHFQRETSRVRRMRRLHPWHLPEFLHGPPRITKHHNPSRKAFQLADVSRPVARLKEFFLLVAQHRSLAPQFCSMLGEKMLHEDKDVFLTVSQRRKPKANSVNSKIKLPTKSSPFNLFVQISGCRRNCSHAPRAVVLGFPIRQKREERFLAP